MNVPEASPRTAVTASRVPVLLAFGAALLLHFLPLLFARWVSPWFSMAASVWTVTLGITLGAASAGLLLGRWSTSRFGGAARWLPIVALLGAVLSLPVSPAPGLAEPAPADAFSALVRLLLMKCVPAAVALGIVIGLLLRGPEPGDTARGAALGGIVGQLLFLGVVTLLSNPHLAVGYSWALLGYALICGAWLLRRPEAPAGEPHEELTGRWRHFLQFLLPGIGVALLIVVTSRLTLGLASVPQFWVMPWLLFLLAGLGALSRPVFQSVPVTSGAGVVACGLLVGVLYFGEAVGSQMTNVALYVALVAGTLAGLGTWRRLVSRPDARSVALLVSGMGAGAVVVALLPPRVANGHTEYHVVCLLLGLGLVAGLATGARNRMPLIAGVPGVLALAGALGFHLQSHTLGLLGRVRTFHGVVGAAVIGSGPVQYVLMTNGDTPVAAQFVAPAVRLEPALYHGRSTGIGALFRSLPKGNFRKVAIIGTGIGNLVAYAHPTDSFRFYEFNPGVALAANTQFGFLPQANFDWALVPGDPRLVLQDAPPERFDVIILDAFNAESLPYHLLTHEAFALWHRHLAPGGVIAVNTTQRRFELLPVVWRQALELGLQTLPVMTPDDPATGSAAAEWVLLTGNNELLRKGNFRVPTADLIDAARSFPLWTDETARPLSVLR